MLAISPQPRRSLGPQEGGEPVRQLHLGLVGEPVDSEPASNPHCAEDLSFVQKSGPHPFSLRKVQ